MGSGGSKNSGQQLQMQMSQQQATLNQQNADELQNMQTQQKAFDKQQDDVAIYNRTHDTNTQAQVDAQFQNALQQTAAKQANNQLSIMDFIHTSPEGLFNDPKTQKLNLLGN